MKKFFSVLLVFSLLQVGLAYAADTGTATLENRDYIFGLSKQSEVNLNQVLFLLAGKDGTPGAAGKDGIPGIDGLDGKDGKDGVDGKDGKDGVNGTSYSEEELTTRIGKLVGGLESDLKENQAVVESGRNPIMTADYIKMIYADLAKKVEEMTKKK